jgi:hypothetical protein
MKKYSEFFKTLHDESSPTGCFGRGSHYSVLRSMTWFDESGRQMPHAQYHDLAVVWDEDHDERVIPVVERLYQEGLLSRIKILGERKGTLTLLLSGETLTDRSGAGSKVYHAHAQSACDKGACDKVNGDYWPVTLGSLLVPEGIIDAEDHKVVQYLGTIDMLWQLGVKPI